MLTAYRGLCAWYTRDSPAGDQRYREVPEVTKMRPSEAHAIREGDPCPGENCRGVESVESAPVEASYSATIGAYSPVLCVGTIFLSAPVINALDPFGDHSTSCRSSASPDLLGGMIPTVWRVAPS